MEEFTRLIVGALLGIASGMIDGHVDKLIHISGIFMMIGRPDSLGEYIVSVVIAV